MFYMLIDSISKEKSTPRGTPKTSQGSLQTHRSQEEVEGIFCSTKQSQHLTSQIPSLKPSTSTEAKDN